MGDLPIASWAHSLPSILLPLCACPSFVQLVRTVLRSGGQECDESWGCQARRPGLFMCPDWAMDSVCFLQQTTAGTSPPYAGGAVATQSIVSQSL